MPADHPALPWLEPGEPLPLTRDAWPAGSPAPGLLAASATVDPDRLDDAYRHGIFPWFSPGEPVLWWSTDPRMVLPVDAFRLSHSLRKTLRTQLARGALEIRFDHDLPAVLQACARVPRAGQDGTWIVPSMVRAYLAWHEQGRVHSVETWWDGELAGGLYVVAIGRMVYGESMFTLRTDASKIALAALVAFCRAHDVTWIDCQQQTRHLASLGAAPVARADFEAHLDRACGEPDIDRWTYDPAHWRLLGLDVDVPDAATRPGR